MDAQNSSQLISVNGKVTDEKGEPIIGASVLEIGSNRGTATDIDGNFTLKVTPQSILRFSYIGYATHEEKEHENMFIKLREDNAQLDEVVVVAYGQQKKVNLTGAVSSVDIGKTLDSRPQQDLSKALQGAVPGLSVISNQGGINGEPQLKIRGLGTLSASNSNTSPLIVVDGVQMDDISFLNTNDIQNVTVLKDAASSSIYGTRAAFGVILITTKSAKRTEKVTVNYNNNFAWDQATYLPNFPDVPTQIMALSQANKRAGFENELFGMYLDTMLPYAQAWQKQNGGKTGYRSMRPYVDANDVGDYFVNADGSGAMYYADWDVKKIMFRNWTPSMTHNLSIQGSSGKTNYYISFGYNDKNGILRYGTDDLKKYTASVNVNTAITDWLTAGVRFNYSDKVYKEPNTQRSTYTYMWRWGSFFGPYGTINGVDCRNDIAYLKQAATDKSNTTYTRINAYIKADITKDITLNADYTYNLTNETDKSPGLPVTFYNTWGGNISSPVTVATGPSTYIFESSGRTNWWTINIYGNYEHIFNNDHHINVMLGGTADAKKYNYFWARRGNLIDGNLPEFPLATGDQTVGGEHTHEATAGYFGRINYDWKGILLLEVNGRYDGSSSFPQDDHWAFFPSASVGYRFSEQKYFNKLRKYITNGKARVSYGEIGNQNVGNRYRFLSTISAIPASSIYWLNADGTKVSAYYSPSMVSKSLKWERVQTLDLGLDLGFMKNELTASIDYFQRTTKDMLAPGKTMPQTLGATAPYVNAGTLRARGWEVTLDWRHAFGEWNVYANFNISDAIIKVTKWNDDSRLLNSNYSGQTYGDIWGFETERYFTTDDFNSDGTYKTGIASQQALEQTGFKYGPGDIKFKDIDGNGVINGGKGTQEDHGDLKVIGNTTPRYEYSFHLGGSYKGFDIDCFFQGVGKRSDWTQSAFVMPFMRGADAIYSNQTSYCSYNYDTEEYDINQSYDYPRMYPGNAAQGNISVIARGNHNFYPQSKYLVNMAYLRFKNVTFGYTLPSSLVQKAYLSKVRFYFSASNICNIIKKSRYPIDPEIDTSENGTDLGNGTWGRVAPMTRTISFGLQATF